MSKRQHQKEKLLNQVKELERSVISRKKINDNMKEGLADIQKRIKTMSLAEFRSFWNQAKNKLDEIEEELNQEPTDAYIAFQTLKKTVAMLLTWEEYWDAVCEANGIDKL